MRSRARAASLAFASGVAGALGQLGAAWLAAQLGLPRAIGVALAPSLAPPSLYPRLVWGGLFGLLLLLPLAGGAHWVRRGLLVSLAPALFQLLWVFPFQAGRGPLGLELGWATPLWVVALSAVWGLGASAWLRAVRG